MMRDTILNFPQQFSFSPKVMRAEKLQKANKWIVCGMGGSQLATGLLRAWNPTLDIIEHRSYGLPALSPKKLQERLIIVSSYSGTTEETLDSFHEALKRKLPVAAIAVGGEMEEIAHKRGVSFIKIPDTGIQPRCALGFSIKSLMKLMGLQKGLNDASKLAMILHASHLEKRGKSLAATLKDRVPVMYASPRFASVAYNWKVKLNETGKIPAFYNVFPELNHNEMNGFDVQPSVAHLSERFHFIILKDENDHPRIQKRMDVLTRQYKKRGLPVTTLTFDGQTVFEKMFRSLVIADWTALHLASQYGLEAEQVPMVEEFKKLIQ